MAGGQLNKEEANVQKVQNWVVPLIAVLLGMLIGAVLMLIFGYDPFWACFYDLFYHGLRLIEKYW